MNLMILLAAVSYAITPADMAKCAGLHDSMIRLNCFDQLAVKAAEEAAIPPQVPVVPEAPKPKKTEWASDGVKVWREAEGDSKATIFVRCADGKMEAGLTEFSGKTVKMRFDAREATEEAISEAGLMTAATDKILSMLMRSQVVVEGALFNLRGLDQSIKPVSEACRPKPEAGLITPFK